MKYTAHGASTQSRATRPGRKIETSWCSGSREYLADMRSILSWPLGQHGALLGYPSIYNPHTRELVEKLTGYMNRGIASCGSFVSECEEQLAEMLVGRYSRYMTSYPKVRFAQNGTDVTQAAVALARYATGRERIVSIGYHGGSSPTFNFPPQNRGTLEANYDAVDEVAFDDFPNWAKGKTLWGYAAVIVEVPPVRNEILALATLHDISTLCRRCGCKFIVDDVVTGFRYHPSGVLGYYNQNPRIIVADFICLGKALSTYGKVSALLGPADIMDSLADRVFMSYTYSDHPFGLLDAIETLKIYDQLDGELYTHIGDIGISLMDGLNRVFRRRGFECEVYGHPSRTTIESRMKPELYWEFLSRLVDEQDVLIHRPQFSTMAHTDEDVTRTVEAVDKTLAGMRFELQ